MMKKLICTLIILLAGTAGLQASSPDSLFRQGNAFFNQGLYNDAIAAYQRILNQGDVSWQIYYNLGNAHFKIDELADAIYFYEKALKLDPDNEDIQYNLKIANSKIVDKIEPLPEFFLKKWWKAIYLYFSLTTWSILVIAGFILFILLMVTFLISHNPAYKRFTFWTGILVILFTAISFCAAFKKYHENIKQDEAIVFSPTVTIKSSPNKNAVDLFVLHEGSKVQITDEVNNWYEIKIANGSVGWLPEESVRKY